VAIRGLVDGHVNSWAQDLGCFVGAEAGKTPLPSTRTIAKDTSGPVVRKQLAVGGHNAQQHTGRLAGGNKQVTLVRLSRLADPGVPRYPRGIRAAGVNTAPPGAAVVSGHKSESSCPFLLDGAGPAGSNGWEVLRLQAISYPLRDRYRLDVLFAIIPARQTKNRTGQRQPWQSARTGGGSTTAVRVIPQVEISGGQRSVRATCFARLMRSSHHSFMQ